MTKDAYAEVTHKDLNRLFAKFRQRQTYSRPDNTERLYHEFLAFLHSNLIKVRQPVVEKPCKGTLVSWQRHEMPIQPERSLQAYIYGLLDPQVTISGIYENTAHHTQTSPLISFQFDEEKQEGMVETANSIYQLRGPESDPATGSSDIGE